MAKSLVEVARRHADRRPENRAFVFLDSELGEAGSISYGEMDARALRIAAYLQDHCSPLDRALVLASDSSLFISAFFGCLYAGVIAVPAYPPLSRKPGHRERIEAVLRDGRISMILVESSYAREVQEWMSASEWRERVRCADIEELLRLDRLGEIRLPEPHACAFIQYTSGSTSRPKGVVVTHQNLMENEALIKRCFEHDDATIVASWLPHYHDMGLIGNILQPFYLGVTSVLMTPMTFLSQPSNWLRAISRYRVTTTGGPNFGYQLCVDRISEAELQDIDLSSWTLAYVGAEPVRASTMQQFSRKFGPFGFREQAIYPCYGLAEATLFVTGSNKGSGPTVIDVRRDAMRRGLVEIEPNTSHSIASRSHESHVQSLVGSGSTRTGQRVAIVNPGTGKACGADEVGEIWVTHPSVAAGYWAQPEETDLHFAATIADEPGSLYLRTGDLGFIHDDQLFVSGRLKDLIIIRGRNYAPHDIELTAQECSNLLQKDAGVAFAVEIGASEHLVVVLEVTRAGMRSTALAEVMAKVRTAIIEQHLIQPHAILLIKPGALPKTTSGKVRRRYTRELYECGEIKTVLEWRAVDAGSGDASPSPDHVSSAMGKRLAQLWSEILQIPVERIGAQDNFFDLGGDSVAAVRLQAWLCKEFSPSISLVDVFSYPQLKALATFLEGHEPPGAANAAPVNDAANRESMDTSIAVVGLAGRFPHAADVDEFWRNLLAGRCSVETCGSQRTGDVGTASRDNHVDVRIPIDGIELFDAEYFGLSPKEAASMDPQQRWLLEGCVAALEDAGYADERFAGSIGVFVGRGESEYSRRMSARPDYRQSIGAALSSSIATSNAFAATLISYHLGLTGPSITVDTACSTSLVAVLQACSSVLAGQCDVAVAGGVSLRALGNDGYHYEEGGILSPDGFCRAFSADARGTVPGQGMGLVVLKRLDRALEDGDFIHAVVKGFAINNDGNRKAGYTAPSVHGQAEVIRCALAHAGVSAESIDYVETHGTGTPIGDPIEIAALCEAFGGSGKREQSCAIGSVKTNIGHLDAAAGVASFIKVVLSLGDGKIPPSLHFDRPNPAIEFERTPFFVNRQVRGFMSSPRRAAVSSFGIGGTNAHAILEQPPQTTVRSLVRGSVPSVFVFSAQSERALARNVERFREFVDTTHDIDLADAAFSLQVGRRPLRFRRSICASERNELLSKLERAEQSPEVFRDTNHLGGVTFMFPGQGLQVIGAAQQLYEGMPAYRRAFDDCADIVRSLTALDLVQLMYGGRRDEAAQSTAAVQPALFSVEYALAQLWISLGVRPRALIGHSLGEYVAACLAGVFSLRDALTLIVRRGALMERTEPGSMLAVQASIEDIGAIMGRTVDIAAINTPAHCVVAGRTEDVLALVERLGRAGIGNKLLATRHAFHSRLMEPILEEFRSCFEGVSLRKPKIPFVSNVTGEWIREHEATDREYWVRHVREPVRFAAGLATLDAGVDALLEVGPGQTLASFARKQWRNAQRCIVETLKSNEEVDAFSDAVGALWCHGPSIDWRVMHEGSPRRRVRLPTYAFERKRHWIDETSDSHSRSHAQRRSLEDWFYAPSWVLTPSVTCNPVAEDREAWLLLVDDCGLSGCLRQRLVARQARAVDLVSAADFVKQEDDRFAIDAANDRHWLQVLETINAEGYERIKVLHAWSVARREQPLDESSFEESQRTRFHSLCALTRAMRGLGTEVRVDLVVLTNGLHRIVGDELVCSESATVLGAAKVIPQEERRIRCCCIDVLLRRPGLAAAADVAARQVLAEVAQFRSGAVVAFRGDHRWVRRYEAMRLPAIRRDARRPEAGFRAGGTYVITGGLGNIGTALASRLAETHRANLVLVTRTALPPRERWATERASSRGPLSRKLARIDHLESLGAHVEIARADVSDLEQMCAVVALARKRFGALDGIVHCAADMSEIFVPIVDSQASFEAQARAKVSGLFTLEALMREEEIPLCVVTSSLSAVVGGVGLAGYAALNAFVDAHVERLMQGHVARWLVIDLDAWKFSSDEHDGQEARIVADLMEPMLPAEGVDAIERIVDQELLTNVAVSTTDLSARIRRWIELDSTADRSEADDRVLRARSAGGVAYAPASNDVEAALVHVIRDLLGVQAGIDDDFFDLGGDSLVATQVIARARATLDVAITMEELYRNPTVRKLAECILLKRQVARVEMRCDEVHAAEDASVTISV